MDTAMMSPVRLICLYFYSASFVWDVVTSAELASNYREIVTQYLGGRKLKVVGILEPPYLMFSKDGRGEYIGYLPDVLNLLAERLGFEYELYLVPDGKYGAVGANGKWNGMIGEVKKWQETSGVAGAELTAAALTVTHLRSNVVDFIKPFKHTGITLLIKKPYRPRSSSYFSVYRPFTPAVWATLSAALLTFVLLLWGIHRVSASYGSVEGLVQFDLLGSIWFIFSTGYWQGYDRTPRPVGARVLTVTWFIVVTLVLMTYAAGYVNHFTWMTKGDSFPPQPDINSLSDAVDRTDWNIGAVQGGSTYSFIRASAQNGQTNQVYSRLLERWNNDVLDGKNHMARSHQEAVNKVRQDRKLAFLMEIPSAKYTTQRNCDLMTVGEPFGRKSLGFAVPKNYTLKEALDYAVLQLMETGDLEALEKIWWENAGMCKQPSTYTSERLTVPQSTLQPFIYGILMVACCLVSLLLTACDVLLVKFRGKGLIGDTYQMVAPDLND